MARRKRGEPSGNGLALRMPETRAGIPSRAQKVAAFENSAMLRPGMKTEASPSSYPGPPRPLALQCFASRSPIGTSMERSGFSRG